MPRTISALFIICLSLSSCDATGQESGGGTKPIPSGVSYEPIGRYDVAKLSAVLDDELRAFLAGSPMSAADFKGRFAVPKHPVKLYRVRFDSVVPEWDNSPTVGTGLLAIPDDGETSHPMVSYQHGTVFGKQEVPSIPDESYETRLMLATFASQGYVVIGTDYFGLGTSKLPNSYLVRRASEQASLDMLFASRHVLESMGRKTPQFFLHGWSQGGWTTMVFLRRLESIGVPVTAAATASGGVDAMMAVRKWLISPRDDDAVWLTGCVGNLIWAKEEYHQMPGLAASAIKPEYLEATRRFFEHEIGWEEFSTLVPKRVPEMMRPEFLEGAVLGRGPFWRLLDDMEAYKWRVKTPLHSHFGEVDEVFPPFVVTLPESFQKFLGNDLVVSKPAGGRADHRATYVQSTIEVKPWFDGFVNESPTSESPASDGTRR